MKKIISLALCLMLGSFVLTGCSDNNEPFTEREYTADVLQIEKINIDVCDREIEVSISENHQIQIVYFENSKETYDITVSDESELTMTSVSNKDWKDYVGVKPSAENRKILLQIPNALLDTLVLATTNEDISLPILAVTGNISISSNGGNITFDKLNIGNSITLTAKNGDISGAIVGGYDDFSIESNIKKGKSNLPDNKNGGEKMLNVSNNNGNVNIEFVKE